MKGITNYIFEKLKINKDIHTEEKYDKSIWDEVIGVVLYFLKDKKYEYKDIYDYSIENDNYPINSKLIIKLNKSISHNEASKDLVILNELIKKLNNSTYIYYSLIRTEDNKSESVIAFIINRMKRC